MFVKVGSVLALAVIVVEGVKEDNGLAVLVGEGTLGSIAAGTPEGTTVVVGMTVKVDVRVGIDVAVARGVVVLPGGLVGFSGGALTEQDVRDGVMVAAVGSCATCTRGLAVWDSGQTRTSSISRSTAPACQPGCPIGEKSFMPQV